MDQQQQQRPNSQHGAPDSDDAAEAISSSSQSNWNGENHPISYDADNDEEEQQQQQDDRPRGIPRKQQPQQKQTAIAGEVLENLQELITNPGPQDVLLGRGGGTNYHHGNILFRDLVRHHRQRYLDSSKNEKPKVALELVQLWRQMHDPPGRFLARIDETRRGPGSIKSDDVLWYEVGDKKAREKASQTLRDRNYANLSENAILGPYSSMASAVSPITTMGYSDKRLKRKFRTSQQNHQHEGDEREDEHADETQQQEKQPSSPTKRLAQKPEQVKSVESATQRQAGIRKSPPRSFAENSTDADSRPNPMSPPFARLPSSTAPPTQYVSRPLFAKKDESTRDSSRSMSSLTEPRSSLTLRASEIFPDGASSSFSSFEEEIVLDLDSFFPARRNSKDTIIHKSEDPSKMQKEQQPQAQEISQPPPLEPQAPVQPDSPSLAAKLPTFGILSSTSDENGDDQEIPDYRLKQDPFFSGLEPPSTADAADPFGMGRYTGDVGNDSDEKEAERHEAGESEYESSTDEEDDFADLQYKQRMQMLQQQLRIQELQLKRMQQQHEAIKRASTQKAVDRRVSGGPHVKVGLHSGDGGSMDHDHLTAADDPLMTMPLQHAPATDDILMLPPVNDHDFAYTKPAVAAAPPTTGTTAGDGTEELRAASLEEYRQRLSDYINQAPVPQHHEIRLADDEDEGDQEVSDLEDDWEKEREAARAQYALHNGVQRQVNRNPSSSSFMSLKSSMSGSIKSIMSDIDFMSLGSNMAHESIDPSIGTNGFRRRLERHSSANNSLASELTELSHTMDLMSLNDEDHRHHT